MSTSTDDNEAPPTSDPFPFKIHRWIDDPTNPAVIVSLDKDSSGTRYRVNLPETLKRHPAKYEHELFVRTRFHYGEAMRRGPLPRFNLPTASVGEKCLDCLNTALKEGVKEQRRVREQLNEREEDDHLNKIAGALTSILRRKALGTEACSAEERKERLRIVRDELVYKFGDFDENGELSALMLYPTSMDEVISFLDTAYTRRDPTSLPKRLTASAVKNAFLAWRRMKKPRRDSNAARDFRAKVRSASDHSSDVRIKSEKILADSDKRDLLPGWSTHNPSNFDDTVVSSHPLYGFVYEVETDK